jgi:hypothetical protein
MAFGTLVVTFGFGWVFVPDSLVYRVFENGSIRMHRVLILLINQWVALFAGSIIYSIQCVKK